MYNDYITIKISRTDLIDALMNRFTDFSGEDPYSDIYNAFDNYYTSLVEDGALDGAKVSIYEIVDNDWVNNIIVADEGNYKEYVDENDLVEDEDIDGINSFEAFKDYMRDEGRYAAESDNGEVVLIYA